MSDVPPTDEEPLPVEEEPSTEGEPLTVEELLAQLEDVIAQRDEYLGLAQRSQAEFENFRKRVAKQHADDVARASAKLVESMLPVLDAFDYGIAHGDESIVPLRAQLLATLEREGLERLDPVDEPFDPNEHEAVAHEEGDGTEPVVAETLRAGYRWQAHLLRPVMVRVRE